MPDNTPSMPAPPTPPPPSNEPKPLPHMGEEFGTAKKNLPPVKIVAIGVGVIVLTALIIAFIQRPRSSASGSIDNVAFVEVPNQSSVMVAISISLRNNGQKPFWIRDTRAELDTGTDKYSDDGLSAVDFDRYYQAFPALKENSYPALKRESMIPPGGDAKGTMIVSFPVTADKFTGRKSLAVKVQPYDQPVPLTLTK